MNQPTKSCRQILTLIWSVSKSHASQEDIHWVRKEITTFLTRKVTLGFYP